MVFALYKVTNLPKVSFFFIEYPPSLHFFVTNEANRGVQSIVINDLDSNSSYWFQVLPVNGCAAGDWSNWLQAKVSKSGLMGFYRW